MGEAEFSQQLVELLPAFLPVRLDHFQNGADILFHRQATEDGRFLGQVADAEPGAPVHGHAGDVEAFQRDLALIRPDQPGDHVEGRGLAGTVRPQKADGFARLHGQAHIFHHLAAAIGLADAIDDQRLRQFFAIVARFRHASLQSVILRRRSLHWRAVHPIIAAASHKV